MERLVADDWFIIWFKASRIKQISCVYRTITFYYNAISYYWFNELHPKDDAAIPCWVMIKNYASCTLYVILFCSISYALDTFAVFLHILYIVEPWWELTSKMMYGFVFKVWSVFENIYIIRHFSLGFAHVSYRWAVSNAWVKGQGSKQYIEADRKIKLK